MNCSVEGCDRASRSRGMCPPHYAYWYRSGGRLLVKSHQVGPYIDSVERLWMQVDRRGPDECWPWTSATSRGYGRITVDGRLIQAHRYAWSLVNGPVPEGLQIDHLCRNRVCCNPAHLEPVTCQINLLRGNTRAALNAAKTHCMRGHPFSPENTIEVPRGRACRECRAAYKRARRLQAKAKANE